MPIIKQELDSLRKQFYVSRTGVEMLDYVKKYRNQDQAHIAEIFKTFDQHRLTDEEYQTLDEQLMHAQSNSTNICEFRQHSAKLHYANCTNLACFMHEALQAHNIHSRIFSIGGAHHFVIALDESKPQTLTIIDPWANTLFTIELLSPCEDLECLSVEQRLKIAELHYRHTRLYPDYKESLDKLLAQDPGCSSKLKKRYSKQFFEISTTDRFYDFDSKHTARH